MKIAVLCALIPTFYVTQWLDEYICIVNSDVPLPIKCSKTLLVPNNNEEIHVALCEYTPENEGFQFLGKVIPILDSYLHHNANAH